MKAINKRTKEEHEATLRDNGEVELTQTLDKDGVIRRLKVISKAEFEADYETKGDK